MEAVSNISVAQTENKGVLLGILVDVSDSMRKNWQNKEGKRLPRIEVVRNTLNKKAKEALKKNSDKKSSMKNIDIFCLGFGFKDSCDVVQSVVDVEKGRTSQKYETAERLNVICDLLALSEILPSKTKLEDFKERLNQKWYQCAGHIFEQATIVEDVFGQLSEYIHVTLYESAMQKHYQSPLYVFSRRFDRLSNALADYFKNKEENIRKTAQRAATRYTEDVFHYVNNDFAKNQSQYVSLIENRLGRFVASYVASTLQALTLGFTPQEIVDDLDEELALSLARQIYAELNSSVRKHIIILLGLYQQQLRLENRRISATLDMKRVTDLTQRFVQKFGWDYLKPIIDETIYTMFTQQFEEQAKQSLSHWIHLASAREVVRSITQLSDILPAVFEEHVYSDKLMFGSTPFREALDRAAVRFIEDRYKDHSKVLLIISDGEFREETEVMVSANLLKQRGITIISCLVYEKNLLQQLIGNPPKNWPSGARRMLHIASEITEQEKDTQNKFLVKALTDKKLCYQINHANILDELITTLFEESTS